VRDALKPLLDLRKSQAGKLKEHRYKEFTGPDGYRLKGGDGQPESKQQFLARHRMGPGLADPDVVPYYLLLVGGPEEIPYAFQYQLDVSFGELRDVGSVDSFAPTSAERELDSLDDIRIAD
jgi:hypothetical protein